MSTTAVPPPITTTAEPTISAGLLVGIVFGLSILGIVITVGVYIYCTRKQQNAEQHDQMEYMHAAFEQAVEAEQKRAVNERWGSYSGNVVRSSSHA